MPFPVMLEESKMDRFLAVCVTRAFAIDISFLLETPLKSDATLSTQEKDGCTENKIRVGEHFSFFQIG